MVPKTVINYISNYNKYFFIYNYVYPKMMEIKYHDFIHCTSLHSLSTPKTRLSTKKCEKPPFLGILGKNGQFWTAFSQNVQNGNFSKKRLEHFSRAYKP